MKHARLPFAPLSKCFLAVVAGMVALLSAATGFARGDAAVVYDPVLQPLGSVVIPFQSHYTLSITSPENYPNGVSSSITFVPTVNDSPDNVDDATALSYLSFSVSSLTFTGPLETKSVVVNLNVPANAVTGAYAYQFKTAGWPSILGDLGGFTDLGAAVNMTATTGPLSNPPAVTIATPVDQTVITVPFTSLPVTVPLRFTATATLADPVTRVDADVLGFSIALDSITGLGTDNVTASGNMSIAAPGDYAVQARGTNLTGTASDSNAFKIVVTAPLPTVVINAPAPSGTTFTFDAGTGPYLIPFSFTGTSGATSGIRTIAIAGLVATLDGVQIPSGSLNFGGLGTPVATATNNLSFTGGGSHTLVVTTTDEFGATATATTTFTIVVNSTNPSPQTVRGLVFFDANFNGALNADEPGLAGITVKLFSGTTQIACKVTAADGSYSFTVNPGAYVVSVSNAIAGLSPTTTNLDQPVTVSSGDLNATPVGFGLKFASIRSLKSAALSQGFWKNNVSKAFAGKTNGVQVPAATVAAYTTQISTLALAPFNGLTMSAANSIFNGKVQLQLQLLAAEYNYASGAYIDGSKPLTFAFIYWGEIVMKNTGGIYSSSYQTFAASWFAAYNTSEGGYVYGPLP